MSNFIVTAAPPNPNGDLHLGHLAGPFLTADIAARALTLGGHTVSHVGYIDEHSSYVVRRARELSTDPYTAAAVLGDRIETTLTQANMRPATLVRPLRDPSHDRRIHEGFATLWAAGHIAVDPDAVVFHCTTCARHLYECEIRGACPFCSAPSDGVYCEQCGTPQLPTGLRDPHCTRCGGTDITTARHRRLILDIEKLRPQLREVLTAVTPRPRTLHYLHEQLSRPLAPVPISRIGDYGVPVPIPGWEGHFLDTWFGGVFGYVNAADLDNRRRRRFDTASPWLDENIDVVEAFGFDCSFSHVILWNAIALWSKWPVRLNYLSNEFYQLDGLKFSTSRGHAIWGADYLPTTSSDILRFYMALTGPETETSSFGEAAYQDFATRYRHAIRELFRIATATGTPTAATTGTPPQIEAVVKQCEAAYLPHTFSARAAATVLAEHVIDDDTLLRRLEASAPEARAAAFDALLRAFQPLSPYWTTHQLVQLGRTPAIDLDALVRPATAQTTASRSDPARTLTV
ncbi:class I tRNA ligase family protein [Nocardia sp. alder85J]|uniref:class I tRNA ligase family protein n=1 Tax=Nocardia sp. alder85J TaxID=2862949 RepID=UPI001CD7830C|nr:class I tRNA ligase family protein [Nocardia sp. alder85J]MCX4091982.1 class I tRNA ligase family protein [Nocardia sp. alder85J]